MPITATLSLLMWMRSGVAGVAQFEMPKAFVAMLCMEAHIVGGTLTLSHEHDASQWVPLAKLAEMDLIEGSVRDCMLEYAARITRRS